MRQQGLGAVGAELLAVGGAQVRADGAGFELGGDLAQGREQGEAIRAVGMTPVDAAACRLLPGAGRDAALEFESGREGARQALA